MGAPRYGYVPRYHPRLRTNAPFSSCLFHQTCNSTICTLPITHSGLRHATRALIPCRQNQSTMPVGSGTLIDPMSRCSLVRNPAAIQLYIYIYTKSIASDPHNCHSSNQSVKRIKRCLASRSDISFIEAHCARYPLIFSISQYCDTLNRKNEDQVRVPRKSSKVLLHGVNSLMFGYRYDRCGS